MTSSRVLRPAPSANEIFKSQYSNYLRWASLAAVVITGLLVWFSPRYTPHPYVMPNTALEIITIEPADLYEEPPAVAAPPVVMPEIEPADDDDPGVVDPFEMPFFDRFYQPPVRNPYPTDVGFVASSAKPRLVSRPKPHYPEVARLAQVEGTVIVKVLVGVDGTVDQATIVQGAHPLLNNAALKAARQCVFVPGQQREIKVPTWVAVPYNFRLR